MFFFCFVLADKIVIPAWLALGRLLATFGLSGVAFDLFLGFGEVLGQLRELVLATKQTTCS